MAASPDLGPPPAHTDAGPPPFPRWPFPFAVGLLLGAALTFLLTPSGPPPALSVPWDTGWLPASRAEVVRVVTDVHAELTAAAGPLPPITVHPTRGPSRVTYGALPGDPVAIHLDPHARDPAVLAARYAGLLGRVLVRPHASETDLPWLDDLVADTAALFVLDRLRERWADAPPVPGATVAAIERARLLGVAKRPKPAVGARQRYRRAHRWVRTDPIPDAPTRLVLADAIAALLTAQPHHWDAMRRLHPPGAAPGWPIVAALDEWFLRVGPEHQPFVEAVSFLLIGGGYAPRPTRADALGPLRRPILEPRRDLEAVERVVAELAAGLDPAPTPAAPPGP